MGFEKRENGSCGPTIPTDIILLKIKSIDNFKSNFNCTEVF